MTITSSLAISRTSLSLADLTLTNNPFSGSYTYPEDGLSVPNFSMRLTYAPESMWIPGRLVLGAVMDGTEVPLTVYAKGTTSADLQAKKADLEAAFAQFSYTITMLVDGVTIGTWPADPTSVWWGVVDHGQAEQHFAVGTVSIPVNPPTS